MRLKIIILFSRPSGRVSAAGDYVSLANIRSNHNKLWLLDITYLIYEFIIHELASRYIITTNLQYGVVYNARVTSRFFVVLQYKKFSLLWLVTFSLTLEFVCYLFVVKRRSSERSSKENKSLSVCGINVASIFTAMAQFRRDYFELKRAEAMDIADPKSFAVHRKTSVLGRPEYRPRKPFCTLHSNRNCCECKKKKILTQKRRKQRSLGVDVLVNDYHGFHWIDPKVNEFQTLNVAGKGFKTSPDIQFHNSGVFQNNRLFFPELALNRPILVTGQAGLYRKLPRERKESLEEFKNKDRLSLLQSFENKKRFMPVLNKRKESWEEFENNERLSLLHVLPRERKEDVDSFEDNPRLPVFDVNQGESSSEMKVLESTNKEKRRINVVLPRIS